PGGVFGPHVRGFNFDNAVMQAMPKLSFFAFSTLKYGARAVGGEVDGDGFDEIVATPGPSSAFGANVRAFDYDGAAISAIGKINFFGSSFRYGGHAACGDVDR